ncbi:ABC transporter permease [Natribaculum luteum]|uniref:ABC transporter permease n=1 Tax=Natribaculum luteum TaxID=1586232 RepID=A0ABD5NW85_9EURY|nr:ABC transporter permease subunit [Natribaculum luteum]
MSYRLVARKDFEDVVRSKMLWSILGVFVLLMAIISFGIGTNDLGDATWVEILGLFNSLGAQLLIPVTALIFGYMAIAGERQSGSLRILFGLSHDRRDVVFGKFCSRVAIMVVAAVLLCLVTLGVALALFGVPDVGTFLAFAGLTVLLAASFTGIAVGISSLTGNRAKAMGGAIGSYVVFVLLWHPFVAAVHYLSAGELVGYDAPSWYFLLLRLNPLVAYRDALGLLTDQYLWPIIGWSTIVEDVSMEQASGDALLLTNRLSGDLPFYLTEWGSVVVLLAWLVVPVAVGYWHFSRADLN